MRRYLWLVAVAAVVLLSAHGAWARKGETRIDGVVTSISGSSITVRGASGQHYVVLMQSNTQVSGRARNHGIRVGDRVRVDSFRLDDGRFIASRVQVRGQGNVAGYPYTTRTDPLSPYGGYYGGYTPGYDFGRDVTVEGVVVTNEGGMLTVQTGSGVVMVGVTRQTDVTNQRNDLYRIRQGDIVRVYGRHVGPQIVARAVEVRTRAEDVNVGRSPYFNPYPSYTGQAFGRIVDFDRRRNEIRLDNGTVVRVGNDTRVTWLGRDIRYQDLREGMVVRVFGGFDGATVISVEQ